MPAELTKIPLTKRNFVGYSYFHFFTNDDTGEEVVVETTRGEYERMGSVNGSRFNPTLPGHTWKYSLGRAVKVDTPNGLMNDKEYTLVDDVAYICLKKLKTGGISAPSSVVVNDELDLTKIEMKLDPNKL